MRLNSFHPLAAIALGLRNDCFGSTAAVAARFTVGPVYPQLRKCDARAARRLTYSSTSRRMAGLSGFLTLTQSLERPER